MRYARELNLQRESVTSTVLAERFALTNCRPGSTASSSKTARWPQKEVHRAALPAFPRCWGGAKMGGVMSYEDIADAWLSPFREAWKRPVHL